MRCSSSGCTTPICSPARAASARRRSSRILAKSLNCTGADGRAASPPRLAACAAPAPRSMPTATSTTSSSTPPRNRGIDEIRDLLERAAYKPGVGRFKVFMIDEAHQLTKDAFNALLKTLEEPPEYLKFVLATTDPEKMLPTVLSRCLQFNLRPMAPETVHRASAAGARGRRRGQRRRRAAAACRARRAARCATRCRSPTRRSPTAAAGSTRPACARCSARSIAATRPRWSRRWRGATAPAVLARWTRCARTACRPPARSRNGGAAAADGGRAGRARRAATTDDPDRGGRARAWPRCCRPTRPSCSTASCCRPRRAAAWRPTSTAR